MLFQGQIDRDVVKKTHFGGFSDDEPEEDEEEVQFLTSGVWLLRLILSI